MYFITSIKELSKNKTRKNKDIHETWSKDVVWVREEPIQIVVRIQDICISDIDEGVIWSSLIGPQQRGAYYWVCSSCILLCVFILWNSCSPHTYQSLKHAWFFFHQDPWISYPAIKVDILKNAQNMLKILNKLRRNSWICPLIRICIFQEIFKKTTLIHCLAKSHIENWYLPSCRPVEHETRSELCLETGRSHKVPVPTDTGIDLLMSQAFDFSSTSHFIRLLCGIMCRSSRLCAAFTESLCNCIIQPNEVTICHNLPVFTHIYRCI